MAATYKYRNEGVAVLAAGRPSPHGSLPAAKAARPVPADSTSMQVRARLGQGTQRVGARRSASTARAASRRFWLLLNRSRYAITHHTVIGYNTLSELLPHPDRDTRAEQAEAMLLHLVDEHGNPTFDHPGAPPYTPLHLACLRLAAATRTDPHGITDDQVRTTHRILVDHAPASITAHGLDQYPGTDTPAYRNAYATGMLVELTWLTVHFSGLLNVWFTVLHTFDEATVTDDDIGSITVYNTTVPTSIRRRNNALLGPTGWGDQPPNATRPQAATSSIEALAP
ncbi:hypothetical protein ACRAKI_21720 [Saccharothrix isguenensis]